MRLSFDRAGRLLAAAVLAFALTACGGGSDDPSAPSVPLKTHVGPAGGTAVGPNRAQVVVPAGALAQATEIGIEQMPTGAPPLPKDMKPVGTMFAITPHGTTFARPVTVTLPFDLSAVPVGTMPVLLKTNARNEWEQVATATFKTDSMSASMSGFSHFQVVIPPTSAGKPVRVWSFRELRGDALEEVEVAADIQIGGFLAEVFDHGPAFFDAGFLRHDRSLVPPDGIATSEIVSYPDGVTYWVNAEAPSGNAQLDEPIGSEARLVQYQTFVKNSVDATYSFTLSKVHLTVLDGNSALRRRCPPHHVFGAGNCDLVGAEVFLNVVAFTDEPDEPKTTLFTTAGHASVTGGAAANAVTGQSIGWTTHVFSLAGARSPLWNGGDFAFEFSDLNGPEGQLDLKLDGARRYVVDIASVPVGKRFTVVVEAYAKTYNRAAQNVGGTGSEFGSGASATLRDPSSLGGTTVVTTGLTLVDTALPLTVPADGPIAPAACTRTPSPDPAAGTLQFSAADYRVGESNTTPTATVTRTGGSTGAVTATITTSSGTATAGSDYTPVNTTVFFADGDAEPRVIAVPIQQDRIAEPGETVTLTLSQPGGCGALGTQTTAVLTIVDDDQPPAATFTVGGMVTGLTGSGLVLTSSFGADLPISANGAFTFAQALLDRLPYDVSVRTQPSNPAQLCVVTRGSGTIAGANVTDVAVDCTVAAGPSGLDASFGVGGKTTTAATGIADAIAVQPDGKIVTVGGAFTLTRHNPDGSLDTGFGVGGKVSTTFASGTGSANDVALQSDGKIIAVGSTRARSGFASDDNFMLRRYDANGNLDPGFGTGGVVVTDFAALADVAKSVAIQSDGKIVVAGTSQGTGGVDFALVRYNADGSPDTGFGTSGSGKVVTDVAGGSEGPPSVALQTDGGIVIAGRFGQGSTIGGTAVLRYTSAGVLDLSFGQQGKATSASLSAEAMIVQADGKIVIGGGGSSFGLIRFFADGSPDAAFGTVTTRFFNGGNGSIGRNVAVQGDGKLVVVGEAASGGSSTFDWAVARFNADGSIDTGFGTNGQLVIDFFGAFDGASDVAMQRDGRIVVGGTAGNGSLSNEFALVRINP